MSLEHLRDRTERTGSHWFDASSMRFFGSRILPSTVTQISANTYRLVSSEREPNGPRLYTVRVFQFYMDPRVSDGRLVERVTIDNVGEFQHYADARTAKAHLLDES